jgi:hypothetical protein
MNRMNANRHRSPVTPASTRARCPVCHEAVYSKAGIHPQCAVRQSEPPRPKPRPPGSVDPSTPLAESTDPDVVESGVDLPEVEAADSAE